MTASKLARVRRLGLKNTMPSSLPATWRRVRSPLPGDGLVEDGGDAVRAEVRDVREMDGVVMVVTLAGSWQWPARR